MREWQTASDAARQAVVALITSINEHDVERICSVISEDHCFTDGLGQVVRGRERMREAWTAYFRLVPDYAIVTDVMLSEGSVVGLFGSARGTVSLDGDMKPGSAWSIPFAARAVVEAGAVAEWQIYCDNERVRQILQRI